MCHQLRNERIKKPASIKTMIYGARNKKTRNTTDSTSKTTNVTIQVTSQPGSFLRLSPSSDSYVSSVVRAELWLPKFPKVLAFSAAPLHRSRFLVANLLLSSIVLPKVLGLPARTAHRTHFFPLLFGCLYKFCNNLHYPVSNSLKLFHPAHREIALKIPHSS